MLLSVSTKISRLSALCGAALGWVSLALVLVSCAVVLLRYGLELGSIALQESAIYLHCLLFMLGAGYTLQRDDHVRVDIFYRRMRPRGRALVDLLGALLLLIPFAASMIWLSADYVAAAWKVREGSQEAGGLPWLYLLKTLIPVMCVALILQGIAQALASLALLLGQAVDTAPADHSGAEL